ncbi:thiamine monophosphate synthase [Chlorobaculum parvum NCIB 8327]|uniref:Thiamine monophosphate synthase n=2 Tax=Chlorobaculum parvum TaxID=274539 RepID=B3QNM1_CHLP8|nr:thiamine monophosphate synthase [Chlorobaculum parvum NCIB 8327]
MVRKQTPLPRLMIVSSGEEHRSLQGLALRQAEALGCSAPVVYQLREKGLDAGELEALCRQIVPAIKATGSLFTVNERFDIALTSKASGVHLPEASCPPDAVRKAAPSLIVGQSVHSAKAARAATAAGLDYLLFGPVFQTPSKEPFGAPQGLERLREVCRATPLPVFAVGGITPERSPSCIECGAWGVAAMRPFFDPETMPETINLFLSYLPS